MHNGLDLTFESKNVYNVEVGEVAGSLACQGSSLFSG
jgi:hypothetical protein